MKTIKMLTMAAVCATAMTGWARTMFVTSIANRSVTLAFGEPDGNDYTLCVAYGNASGGEDKYKWTSFSRNVAMIGADQTTCTYQLPAEFTSGTFYRFFLLQTEVPYERELEYIASTATSGQFIDTEIEGKLGLKMECNIVWLEGNDSVFLGSRNGGNGRFHMGYVHKCTSDIADDSITFGYGLGTLWTYREAIKKWKKDSLPPFHVVSEMKTNLRRLEVNGTELAGLGSPYPSQDLSENSTPTTGLNMYIFCNHYGSSATGGMKMKLYDMKIWQDDGNGDVLVRNYRPVYANGDGALYDEVSGEVFKNGGSIKFALGELPDAANRSGIVRAMSQELAVLTDEERQTPVISYWVGGEDGDLANVANWCSTNIIDEEVAAVPVRTTEVHFSGSVNASWASASDTLGAAKIVCEDVHLAGNCDWRVFGSVPFEGNLNLNGWKLQLAGLTGTGAITDRPFAVAGYEALAYIESQDGTGGSYIDSEVTGATGATVEIDVMGLGDRKLEKCMVGTRLGTKETGYTRFFPFYTWNYCLCFGYNEFRGGSLHENDGFVQDKRYVGYNRMRDGSQSIYMNGLLAWHDTIAGAYDTGLNMFIFAMNDNGSPSYWSKQRLYAARFWVNDGAQMARDFVPVKRTDGVLGLYDKVASKFHENLGKLFKAGPVVTAASGSAGELWVEVAKGVTNVNTGVLIGGSAKLVKSGKGVYKTMVVNHTYTGGTRVADGIFDQGVNSTNDSMPMGQNEVTVVFDKEAGVKWNDGYYFTWETRPANTTFTLSPAMRFKGFALVERTDGIFIKQQPEVFIIVR